MQAIIPNVLEVKIEKLSNMGLGIAKVEGFVIFVENSCPGDLLRVEIYKKNKNFAFAHIVEILKASPYRVEPFCPMQKICGSCQLQFIDYNYQLVLKKEIVKDAMRSIAGEEFEVRDVIPSPENKNYRHKIQYPVSQTKNSKRLLAGYYKKGSHDILNIKYCPIQPSICDNIIDFIREEGQKLGVSGYEEKNAKGLLRHVVMRSSCYSGKVLVVLVINDNKITDSIKKLGNLVYDKFDEVSGVLVNFNTRKTNLILGDKVESICGDDYIEEKLCDKIFKVGAKTFFQVNPKSANNIFEYVKKYVEDNFNSPIVLDAYAGITAFGICLSDVAKKIVSVEEVKESVDLANQIVAENNIDNIDLCNMDAGKCFEIFLKLGGKTFDVTILDPPRKGCSVESLEYALKLTKSKIIYISCNPATLARDLKYLTSKGAKVDFIQPFDMFPHTYHVENVALVSL